MIQTAENRKTPPHARRGELLGTIALHWKTPPVAHGRSIVPNRSELEGISASESNSQKPKDAVASASCRAIGDNSSTLEDVAACASGGAIGDNSSTLQDSAVLQKLIL